MLRRAVLGSFALVALLIASGPGAALAQEAAFVGGTEDVPLMPGLADLPDRLVVFDAPGGRIVEAFATGAVGRAELRRFYDEALAALGWRAARPFVWTRAAETLTIDVPEETDGKAAVRFSIHPRGS
ncbi:MAG: hypothetical protein FJX56_13170 [Alphaproteobacteria bacterium]|nr:hypothetical protein [Alphaproteobacteria bacterium]